MTTMVYCTDGEIQIVSGLPRRKGLLLKTVHREQLPDGVVKHGRILDELELKGTLLSLRERKLLPRTGVELVLSAAAVETRRVSVPLLPVKKLRQLVKSEFSESDKRIYDYAVLERGSSGGVILCGAVEPELLDRYREAFCAVGVNLHRIDAAPGALARFLQLCFPEGEACVCMVEKGFCHLIQLRGGSFSSGKVYSGVGPLEALRDFTDGDRQIVLCGPEAECVWDTALLEQAEENGFRFSQLTLPSQVDSSIPEGRSSALVCTIAALMKGGVKSNG